MPPLTANAPQAPADSLDLLYVPDEQSTGPVRLEDVIRLRGLVTDKQLADARQAIADAPGKTLGQALVETGAITDADLMTCVAEQFSLPFERLSRAMVSEEAFKQAGLPLDYLQRNCLLPLQITGECLAVATCEPANIFLLDEVRRRTGRALARSWPPPRTSARCSTS